MKIELRKISFNERMSEETNCFVADLYLDGKKVGECKNEGHGGCTDYYGINHYQSDDIKKMEDYCKTLPNIKYHDMELEQNLESVIDDLLESYIKQKEEKKKEKIMEKSIMFGVPNGYSYQRISWGKNELKNIPLVRLQTEVDKIREKYCKDGVVILNTNLQKLGVV
jgi:hypothetical protein